MPNAKSRGVPATAVSSQASPGGGTHQVAFTLPGYGEECGENRKG